MSSNDRIEPTTTGERLPPLYARWVRELLGSDIPRESLATCEQCAMWLPPGATATTDSIHFDPVIKCCTYIPNIRNFLVGRILGDTDPEARPGRATVEKRIADGPGVTPLGLRQPAVFANLYDNADNFFGRARRLRCPHYFDDGGRCGIWRHRNATCCTWFCKHVRGKVGHGFWRDSLHQLLVVVEEQVARWCVLELGPSDEMLREIVATAEWNESIEKLTAESLDDKVNPERYARLWGEWRGREGEFFARCAELVNPLSWTEVLAIAGPKARAYAQLARQGYGELLSEEIPEALNVGPIQVANVQEGIVRINSYDCYDPLEVPQAVMELLWYFDGRPTAQALAAIAEERGFRLEPALVRKMVDFGLLVRAAAPPRATAPPKR